MLFHDMLLPSTSTQLNQSQWKSCLVIIKTCTQNLWFYGMLGTNAKHHIIHVTSIDGHWYTPHAFQPTRVCVCVCSKSRDHNIPPKYTISYAKVYTNYKQIFSLSLFFSRQLFLSFFRLLVGLIWMLAWLWNHFFQLRKSLWEQMTILHTE